MSHLLLLPSRLRPTVTLHTHRPDSVPRSACIPQVFGCGLSPAGDYLDPRPAASSTLPPVSHAAEPAPGAILLPSPPKNSSSVPHLTLHGCTCHPPYPPGLCKGSRTSPLLTLHTRIKRVHLIYPSRPVSEVPHTPSTLHSRRRLAPTNPRRPFSPGPVWAVSVQRWGRW